MTSQIAYNLPPISSDTRCIRQSKRHITWHAWPPVISLAFLLPNLKVPHVGMAFLNLSAWSCRRTQQGLSSVILHHRRHSVSLMADAPARHLRTRVGSKTLLWAMARRKSLSDIPIPTRGGFSEAVLS
jgi:hypothetical protein